MIWAAATLIFYVLGFALGMATTRGSLPTQPIGGALLASGGIWIGSRRSEQLVIAPEPSVGND